jgi:hypothetical protein
MPLILHKFRAAFRSANLILVLFNMLAVEIAYLIFKIRAPKFSFFN